MLCPCSDRPTSFRRHLSVMDRIRGKPSATTLFFVRKIRRSESWVEAVKHLRTGFTRDRLGTAMLTAEAEKQFCRLANSGGAPLNGEELCGFLKYLHKPLVSHPENEWTWQLAAVNESFLGFMATYAAQLHAQQKFPVDFIWLFLRLFNDLCKFSPDNQGIGEYYMLQPLVDELYKSGHNLSLEGLVQGLVESLRLGGVSTSSLIEFVADRLQDCLPQLSDQQLLLLAESCTKFGADGGVLGVKIVEEFSQRFATFNKFLVPQMVRFIGHRSNTNKFPSARTKFSAATVDQKLCQHIDHFSDTSLAHLSVTFISFDYSARWIDFRAELLRRLDNIKPRPLAELFRYVSLCKNVDQNLLEQLARKLVTTSHELSFKHIRILVVTLCSIDSKLCDSVEKVAAHLAKAAKRHVLSSRSLSLEDCAAILHSLMKLKACPESLKQRLANILLSQFSSLSNKELSQFVVAVSFQPNRLIVSRLKKELCKRATETMTFDMQDVVAQCQAFARLQLVLEEWLSHAADVALATLTESKNPFSNDIGVVAHTLSTLRFANSEFFDELYNQLEASREVKVFMHQPHAVIASWSLVVQGKYPVKTLNTILSFSPGQMQTLSLYHLRLVLQLSVMGRVFGNLSGLERSSLQVVFRALREEYPHHHYWHRHLVDCLTGEICNVLPAKHLWYKQFIMCEYLHIDVALLVSASGTVIQFPRTFGNNPFKDDVQKLVQGGSHPLALMVFPPACFCEDSSTLLGLYYLQCSCLEACGWRVCFTGSLLDMPKDKKKQYISNMLQELGVNLPVE